jgi:hypothetical protein
LSSENEPEEDLQNLQELQDSSAIPKATTSASQTLAAPSGIVI